ncbi:hypothetical protein MASR1M66_23290 [Aminivibrio sp.]
MIDLLQFEFMRNALYAALLCSALCGILGTFVVVRKYVILAGGVAHAAYGAAGSPSTQGSPPGWGPSPSSPRCWLFPWHGSC